MYFRSGRRTGGLIRHLPSGPDLDKAVSWVREFCMRCQSFWSAGNPRIRMTELRSKARGVGLVRNRQDLRPKRHVVGYLCKSMLRAL